MKKYMFIIPSLSKGGAERVVSILSNELVKEQREVVIITHFITNNDYKVSENVKVICLSELFEDEYRKKISIIYLIKLLFKLRKNIIKENPDYILPFLWTTCMRTDIALMFSKQKKKVIQTVRNNPEVFPQKNILKRYRNYLVRKSRKTIVQNSEQKNYFKSGLHNKIFIMPNPVNSELFDINRNLDCENINIIGVGRLEIQKNFSLLINAFCEVSKKFKNIRLKIYGEGTLKESLELEIKNKKIDSLVKLCGRCSDYNEIYGNASIYVLSSNYEGMPNTLLEAMAVGIPCISTKCPTGPKDIIDNEKNGFLIDVNDKDELVTTLDNLISNKELRGSIGSNAKIKVSKEYTADKIVKKFIKICEEE